MTSRVVRYVRKHGLRASAVRAARSIREAVYADAQRIVLLKELDEIVEAGGLESLKLEELTPSSLPALAELNRKRGRPRVDRRFARSVADGFNGFVVFKGNEAIGYYWWVDVDAPVEHPDLRGLGLGIELERGDVYGSDFFLLSEHRGGGVATGVLFMIESALRNRGYRQLWGYVDSANRPARWLYSTRHYKPMWTVSRRGLPLMRRNKRTPLDEQRSRSG